MHSLGRVCVDLDELGRAVARQYCRLLGRIDSAHISERLAHADIGVKQQEEYDEWLLVRAVEAGDPGAAEALQRRHAASTVRLAAQWREFTASKGARGIPPPDHPAARGLNRPRADGCGWI